MKQLKFDETDFEQWRDNPITQAMFEALRRLSSAAKNEWLAATWEAQSPNVDARQLWELRGKASTAEEIVCVSYSTLETWLTDNEQEQPERHSAD